MYYQNIIINLVSKNYYFVWVINSRAVVSAVCWYLFFSEAQYTEANKSYHNLNNLVHKQNKADLGSVYKNFKVEVSQELFSTKISK